MCNYFFVFKITGDASFSYTALSSEQSFDKAVKQVRRLEEEFIREYEGKMVSIETYIYEIMVLDIVVNSCAGLGEGEFITKCCNQKPIFARLREFRHFV